MFGKIAVSKKESAKVLATREIPVPSRDREELVKISGGRYLLNAVAAKAVRTAPCDLCSIVDRLRLSQ